MFPSLRSLMARVFRAFCVATTVSLPQCHDPFMFPPGKILSMSQVSAEVFLDAGRRYLVVPLHSTCSSLALTYFPPPFSSCSVAENLFHCAKHEFEEPSLAKILQMVDRIKKFPLFSIFRQKKRLILSLCHWLP